MKRVIKKIVILLLALVAGGAYFYIIKDFSLTDYSKEKERLEAKQGPVSSPTELRGTIAFERDRDIWVVGVDGRGEKRLTTYQGLWAPQFSPDGQWIAYASIPQELYGQGVAPTPSNIWIISPDGEKYQKLSQQYRVATGPVWSPDARHLAIATSDSTIVIFRVRDGQEVEFINDAGPLGVIPQAPFWLTENTFVYFKRIGTSLTEFGLGIGDIRSQQAEWLVKKPGIEKIAAGKKGKKLFYLKQEKFYQVDLKSKKETAMDWQFPAGARLTGDLEILADNQTLMAPVETVEDQASPEIELNFWLINTLSSQSVLKRTGLEFQKNLGWSSDGYWLILNAASTEESLSSLWLFNLETEKKQFIIKNASSPSWGFGP